MSEYYDPYMSEPSEPADSSDLSGSAEPADEPKQPRRRQQPAAPKRQQPRPQPKAKPKAKKAPSAAFLVFDARAKMFSGIVGNLGAGADNLAGAVILQRGLVGARMEQGRNGGYGAIGGKQQQNNAEKHFGAGVEN